MQKEKYATPKLQKQEPLQDITAWGDKDGSGSGDWECRWCWWR